MSAFHRYLAPMTSVGWGGEAREPTTDERDFARELSARVADLSFWLHTDADGKPWLLVSKDLARAGAILAVPRVDFDREVPAAAIARRT
jgi:hypothetical protein